MLESVLFADSKRKMTSHLLAYIEQRCIQPTVAAVSRFPTHYPKYLKKRPRKRGPAIFLIMKGSSLSQRETFLNFSLPHPKTGDIET